jgi:hypothetical protein
MLPSRTDETALCARPAGRSALSCASHSKGVDALKNACYQPKHVDRVAYSLPCVDEEDAETWAQEQVSGGSSTVGMTEKHQVRPGTIR